MHVNLSKDAKKKEKDQRDKYNKTIREIDRLVRDVRAYHQRRTVKERKAEQKQQSDLRLESMVPFIIHKEPIHIHANDIRQIEAAVKWQINMISILLLLADGMLGEILNC